MKSFSIGACITLACCISLAHADGLSSLTLTDAEMQKLKKYFPVDEDKNLVWKGDPLIVSLAKNKEKRLVFPSRVLVDVKGNLATSQLRIVNNDKSIYLTALSSFLKERIYVTLEESGEVILLDLVSDEHASNATQTINVLKNNRHSKNSVPLENTQTDRIETPLSSNNEEDVSTVDLMRFAYQQLYAPLRLLQDAPFYTRAAMHTEQFVSNLVYGDKVIAHPIASWMAGNHYVTAIALQNKYPHRTHIDIRKDICGDWQAATLYPRATLLFHGEHFHDSTMLFLVSQKSFGETIGVCHGNA